MTRKAHMCELAEKKEMFPELKEAAKNAKYICTGCGRVAADKERLCCPPEELYDEKKRTIIAAVKGDYMKKTLVVFALLAPLLLAGSAFAQDASSGHKGVELKGSEQPKTAVKKKKGKVEKAVLRKVTAGEIGKEAVCPVTGEKLTVKKNTGSASYKGRNYYFCCPGCDKSFLADPEKFASKTAAAEVKKVYVCPMGDYQGDKPGKCPKCGMNLVEKK